MRGPGCDLTDYEIATTAYEMLSPEERKRSMQFPDSYWVRAIDNGPEREKKRPDRKVNVAELLERVELLEAQVHCLLEERPS